MAIGSYPAAAAGVKAETGARCCRSSGFGHQRFSQSENSGLSLGITFSANRRVL